MRRREFISLLSGATVARPLAASAQIKPWRIGWLDTGSPSDEYLEPLRKGLSELGYAEHRNYVIESRFADTEWDHLPILAKDLVDCDVDAIVTIGIPTVAVAKAATTTIPIVMAGSSDPVERGLVASLAHPGGNVTGVTHSPGPEFAGKCLQLLKEAVSSIAHVAVLWDSSGLGRTSLDAQQVVARNLQVALLPIDVKSVTSADDFRSILFKIGEGHADALFIFPPFVIDKHGQAIADFATARRLLSMFQTHSIVRKGGLLSY
jgi:putative ABC transport system substrate-binding protein